MSNKKSGQMGETITWVVATVVIIVILLISIFISTSYLGGQKTASFSKTNDVFTSKSFFAYLLTGEGETIYEQIKKEENLNDFNGKLAVDIFKKFYKEDYEDIWLGTVLIEMAFFEKHTSNKFFGNEPKKVKSTNLGGIIDYPSIRTKIKLDNLLFVQGEENKYIELALTNPK